ncbi:hypothetical protein AKJ16_DCAP12607 [Drosera capensis]
MGSGKHSSRKRSSPSSSALKAREKKKRSKDRRNKRSRRDQDKSKRHYSDGDSTSISSVAHSISDDDHRTKRRGSSLATRDTKAHKSRADRSPSRSENSEDTRRRRKSKRRKGTDSRRKSKRHDKKRRREPSVDSVSSPSHSCSTCGSRDDNAARNSKTKVRPHKPRQDEKDMGKERSKNNYRSRSCSLSSHRDSENERAESEKRETIENQPKRLKSVVIVADERYRDEDTDDIKDEMVYENDDYPSCRSNDSNDAAGAKDAAGHSITDKFINIEDAREEKGASDVFISTSPGSSGLPGGGLGDEAPSSSRRGEVSDLLKENINETRTRNDAGPEEVDDLEAILRQKALENLKKFRDRAKIHRDEKDNHDGKLKEFPRLSTESVLDRPDKERGAVFATSASLSEDVGSLTMGKFFDVSTHKTGADLDVIANIGTKFRAVKRDSSQIPSRKEPAHEPLPDTARPSSRKNFNERHPNRIIHLSSKRPATTNPSEGYTIHDNAKNQRNLLASTPNQEPSEPNRTLKEASALRDSSHQRVPISLKRALTDAAKSTYSVSQGSKLAVAEGTSFTEAPTTNHSDAVQTANDEQKQISKDEQKQTAKDEQKEGDGSLQFQQKTMSVVRGGELVQVNYKVYIPKKAPALARRNLKR